MTFSLDIEFSGGQILQDFVQTEDAPEDKARDIFNEDYTVISIAIRDEDRKLIKILDWRDAEVIPFGYEELQEG